MIVYKKYKLTGSSSGQVSNDPLFFEKKNVKRILTTQPN